MTEAEPTPIQPAPALPADRPVPDDMRRWLVVGAGSFGTAITHILGRHDLELTLCARSPEHVRDMRDTWTNERFFPGYLMPDALAIETIDDIAGASSAWDVMVLAVPTHAIASALTRLGDAAPTVLSLAKGFSSDGLRMSEVAAGIIDADRYVALTGPNIAAELMDDLPAAAVLSSTDMARAARVQSVLSGFPFRVYLNDDLLGVELAGACKNVVGIAAGICQGAGIGTNGLAGVMTRGMGEIARLGTAMGARFETFLGLAGMGDLITTIASEHSRNRRAGCLLAEGVAAIDVPGRIGQEVEGLRAAPVVARLGREHGVPMNVCSAVGKLATGECDLPEVIGELMARPPEWEFPAPR